MITYLQDDKRNVRNIFINVFKHKEINYEIKIDIPDVRQNEIVWVYVSSTLCFYMAKSIRSGYINRLQIHISLLIDDFMFFIPYMTCDNKTYISEFEWYFGLYLIAHHVTTKLPYKFEW